MRSLLANILEQKNALSVEAIIVYIISATLFSVAIYVSYWYTHQGTTYSRKFNVSLMMLTVLTATVMIVIGNNIALSLGMVGALSIVRFRTAIKDFRDTSYIFWAIIVGITCGVGDYLVAGIGSTVVFILLLIMGRVRNENRILLIIRAARSREEDIEGTVFNYFEKKTMQKVKNTTEQTVEFIFEMTRKTYEISYTSGESIFKKLYDLGDVQYVNIITQSDEISG